MPCFGSKRRPAICLRPSHALVDHRLYLARRLSRPGVGDRRHAASDGDLFPVFTILEDLGYLPRVAFNLDFLFKKAGAHGKQALTMAMGFAAMPRVISTRVINSPRERLIAILTTTLSRATGVFPPSSCWRRCLSPPRSAYLGFVRGGGRWWAGAHRRSVHAGRLVGAVAHILRGEASAFTLELPPYRIPNVGHILYTSLIDRTLFVLWRAIQTAAPAGAVIWILGNISLAA